jgi:hypothetical protein
MPVGALDRAVLMGEAKLHTPESDLGRESSLWRIACPIAACDDLQRFVWQWSL